MQPNITILQPKDASDQIENNSYTHQILAANVGNTASGGRTQHMRYNTLAQHI